MGKNPLGNISSDGGFNGGGFDGGDFDPWGGRSPDDEPGDSGKSEQLSLLENITSKVFTASTIVSFVGFALTQVLDLDYELLKRITLYASLTMVASGTFGYFKFVKKKK